MLLGKGLNNKKGENKKGNLELDDDFVLLDVDIKKSSVNGVPSIEFSSHVNQVLVKEMSTSVVLKLLG